MEVDDNVLPNEGTTSSNLNILANDTDAPDNGTLSVYSVGGNVFNLLTDSTHGSTYSSANGYKQVAGSYGTLYIKSTGESYYIHDGGDDGGQTETFYYVATDGTNQDLLSPGSISLTIATGSSSGSDIDSDTVLFDGDEDTYTQGFHDNEEDSSATGDDTGWSGGSITSGKLETSKNDDIERTFSFGTANQSRLINITMDYSFANWESDDSFTIYATGSNSKNITVTGNTPGSITTELNNIQIDSREIIRIDNHANQGNDKLYVDNLRLIAAESLVDTTKCQSPSTSMVTASTLEK